MNASSLSFQDIILRLQQYWGDGLRHYAAL